MKKIGTVLTALLLSALLCTQAMAGSVALTLVRSTLTNVADAAGTWQYEGGVVQKAATAIGRYAIQRRVVTNGTTPYNNAMTRVDLYIGGPYYNIVMEGSHYFTNGYFFGSTSASHDKYAFLRGGNVNIYPTATVGTSTAYIYWNGSSQLTLP